MVDSRCRQGYATSPVGVLPDAPGKPYEQKGARMCHMNDSAKRPLCEGVVEFVSMEIPSTKLPSVRVAGAKFLLLPDAECLLLGSCGCVILVDTEDMLRSRTVRLRLTQPVLWRVECDGHRPD